MNLHAWLQGLVGRTEPGLPTGMDRRRFLTILGGTAAGVALAPMLDVDKLLWTPSPSIIVPQFGIEAMEVGDIFTIGGIYSVNPLTAGRTLQEFVVTGGWQEAERRLRFRYA